jgi:hypothetical protein
MSKISLFSTFWKEIWNRLGKDHAELVSWLSQEFGANEAAAFRSPQNPQKLAFEMDKPCLFQSRSRPARKIRLR